MACAREVVIAARTRLLTLVVAAALRLGRAVEAEGVTGVLALWGIKSRSLGEAERDMY
jgi:phage-related baseplate assembly protein